MHEYLGIAIKWILAAVVHTNPVVKQQTGQRQQVAKVYCMLQKVSSVSENLSVSGAQHQKLQLRHWQLTSLNHQGNACMERLQCRHDTVRVPQQNKARGVQRSQQCIGTGEARW